MIVIDFTLATAHRHGAAFYDYLGLRKRYFVDGLHWDLPHDDEVEMDQYDNPAAHYVLATEGGAVLGGARGMSMTAAWGRHSNMLRDARDGLLPGIDPAIVPGETDFARCWECTRFVLSRRLATRAARADAITGLLDRICGIVRDHGGERVMSLSPLPMVRTLRQLGYAAERRGAAYTCPEDGRRYAVIDMPASARNRTLQPAMRSPVAGAESRRAA
ncbi:acyl-homoserine-lactone synthase [Wenxinia saemankumensis]|uniref:Acyl-homoserine-lactone synthase n=1 Tax=Wenxinia saemankumensis TaxID=1447782 RepID=A0A1M6EXQ9_9RHOB|nr:acyl-homoserine-lactone synthase [Wenxinia saemankumensis]SHI90228.1 acyl homoserine lactone synthase [Wenxinia saemankumensis]